MTNRPHAAAMCGVGANVIYGAKVTPNLERSMTTRQDEYITLRGAEAEHG